MGGSRRDVNRGFSSRGQTGFDFLVGMSVFLVTVGMVLTFAPGLFQPFQSDTGPNMVTAERSASHLAADLLVEDPTDPSHLNATCTADFFHDDPDAPGCRFDHDGTDLAAALGASEGLGLNVTIESSGSILVLDGGKLAAGRAPPATADTVVGKRGVIVSERQATLLVRVW